ncbi:peptide-methionine (S)-S-oxide reductase MsrA [Sphingomonas sp. AP4-R1]|uniref:peptide-methionine (S)-S-oxide reductase MsrA n=1 Tax=Sphingomonas sp. AP4-R1 TaxID=2735134 RepID=UPI001493C897|nr:peptide-methionine (S)-S-oxide reductase MsrA [Sphingomonas sp. AP4-R1]QJU57312.1 peptide-methionine (S)-S-oxide reductase MsrA [Sphingomonas sp. AP4-R1]
MSSFASRILAGVAALGLGYALVGGTSSLAAETAINAPAPAITAPATGTSETAMFAGGCFWGVQGVFQHVKGVKSALSGYTGGSLRGPNYERVSEGDTGHAESVKVVFDPRVVSYADLLRVYFSVITDPTQLNRQGPDTGTQYRSALFPTSPEQQKVAEAYLAQLRLARLWQRPIVTRIEKAQAFYPAEGYHQDYLTLHPDAGYIRYNDLPKVAALKRLYPQFWREKPVLVRG